MGGGGGCIDTKMCISLNQNLLCRHRNNKIVIRYSAKTKYFIPRKIDVVYSEGLLYLQCNVATQYVCIFKQ